MHFETVTRPEAQEVLARIFAVFGEIFFNPQPENTALYADCEEAFNDLAKEIDFDGEPFRPVTFDAAFSQEFARLFYGVGDKTFGLTHSFWSEGGIALTGHQTQAASEIYRKEGLNNATTLPEDHIAVETAFLARLLSEDKVQTAQTFAQDEILAWWPSFIIGITKQTQNTNLLNFLNALNSALLMLCAMKD